jgi:Ca2+-binding RTX toxin-like protein
VKKLLILSALFLIALPATAQGAVQTQDPDDAGRTTVGTACDNPTIVGTTDDEVLHGTERRETIDVIVLYAGDDISYGLEGVDRICGGRDDDFLSGDQNRDWLLGGPGRDTLWGYGGADHVYGGRGHDTCHVEAKDVVRGCEVVNPR